MADADDLSMTLYYLNEKVGAGHFLCDLNFIDIEAEKIDHFMKIFNFFRKEIPKKYKDCDQVHIHVNSEQLEHIQALLGKNKVNIRKSKGRDIFTIYFNIQ